MNYSRMSIKINACVYVHRLSFSIYILIKILTIINEIWILIAVQQIFFFFLLNKMHSTSV